MAKPKKKAGGKAASSALPVGMHSISNVAHGDNDDSSNISNTDAATYKPQRQQQQQHCAFFKN
ncbi:hypothetical protein C8J57DRAFT_1512244 [Mycena rebaudengoi]|nr:hypothetical protein C8J57DRAFT_1512244 [Mycena rebaudengoi]